MITISSIFRNALPVLPRYFTQVSALAKEVELQLVLGEGDSEDNTGSTVRSYLRRSGLKGHVITCNHGGPKFESVDVPERWAQISKVVCAVKDEVTDPGDAYIWVEGDLIWETETMLDLLSSDKAVAPMILASDNPTRLYDYWGARQHNRKLLQYPPYFYDNYEDRYVLITHCGSCFVIPKARFGLVKDWNGVWPFPGGVNFFMDQESIVRHP